MRRLEVHLIGCIEAETSFTIEQTDEKFLYWFLTYRENDPQYYTEDERYKVYRPGVDLIIDYYKDNQYVGTSVRYPYKRSETETSVSKDSDDYKFPFGKVECSEEDEWKMPF